MIKKQKTAVLANLFSFFVLGLSGVLVNLIIGRYYTPEVLGVFNQTFALFIFISQLASWGVHLSVFHSSANLFDDRSALTESLSSASMSALFVSFIVVAVAYLLAPLLLPFFNSDNLIFSWRACAWGLLFFALNKVFFSFLNGTKRMLSFAAVNVVRGLGLVGSLCIIWYLQLDPNYLSMILALSELLVFIFCLVFVKEYLDFKKTPISKMRAHLSFGSKSFLGGTFLELNSRVDVMILGLLSTDKQVGLYSMAAFVYEGLIQFSVIIRNFAGPEVAKIKPGPGYRSEILVILKRFGGLSFFGFIFLVATAWFLFPHFLTFVVGNNDYVESVPILRTLLLSLIIVSPLLPFNLILVQLGRPGLFTQYQFFTVVLNAVICFIFVKSYGALGAAIGLAGSSVVANGFLFYLILRANENRS